MSTSTNPTEPVSRPFGPLIPRPVQAFASIIAVKLSRACRSVRTGT